MNKNSFELSSAQQNDLSGESLGLSFDSFSSAVEVIAVIDDEPVLTGFASPFTTAGDGVVGAVCAASCKNWIEDLSSSGAGTR